MESPLALHLPRTMSSSTTLGGFCAFRMRLASCESERRSYDDRTPVGVSFDACMPRLRLKRQRTIM
jgi:hypothetical protein